MNIIAPYLAATAGTPTAPTAPTATQAAAPAPCPLIGFTGHAGAGKDSAATVLHAAGWQTIAFADALRIEIAAAFHIDVRLLTHPPTKDVPQRALAAGNGENANWLRFAAVNGHSLMEPRSPRWLMQQWGTEFRRRADPQHWVRQVLQWVQFERKRNPPGLAVTDVRFANEALALRGLGGHIVRVHRPAGTTALAPDTAGHASERHTELHADADVQNTGTLAELSAEVWRVVGQLAARTPAAA